MMMRLDWRFLSLLCCFILIAAANPAAGEDKFDFLLLSREWPFSFCSINSCTNEELLQQKFNIHGLWAELADNATRSPRDPAMFCNQTKFNISELDELTDDLMANWMNLKNPSGSAKDFWRQEFFKHGSCVASDYRYNSTYLYFKAALDLNANYNLMDMLAAAGIQPTTTPINSSDIRSALRAAFGFDGGVRCAASTQTGQIYLYELRLCFTKDLQPMSCGETPEPPQQQQQQQQQQHPQHQRPHPVPRESFLLRSLRLLRSLLFSWQPPSVTDLLPTNVRDSNSESHARQSSGTYACREGEMVLFPGTL